MPITSLCYFTEIMRKAYYNVSPLGSVGTSTQQSPTIQSIDWSVCIICQERISEKLVQPKKGTDGSTGLGYQYVGGKLQEFHELGYCFSDIDFSHLDDGTGVAETLQKHNAVWHKTCRDKISSRTLERAKKENAE